MHVHDHAGHAAPPLLSIVDHPGHLVKQRHHISLDLPSHATVEEEAESRRNARAQGRPRMPMTSPQYLRGRALDTRRPSTRRLPWTP
jgi:hypothetical protein